MADREPQQEKDKRGKEPHHHRLPSTEHAVRITQAWKPALARRQSLASEDRKHDLQLGIAGMGAPLPEGYSQVSERAGR